jgi:hypothetical protein
MTFIIGVVVGYAIAWGVQHKDALKIKFAELKQKYKPKA